MVTGIALPFTPLGATLGFAPLPGRYFLALGAILLSYMLLTQVVKRWYVRRYARWL
jgi:Mg2+-importing ATPase